MSMKEVIEAINNHFKDKSNVVDLFSDQKRQVEGWFSGEIMVVLEKLKEKGKIINWKYQKRGENNNRKRIDFYVEINNTKVFIEVKNAYIGSQGDYKFPLNFYFSDMRYINADIEKLRDIREENSQKYCLIFIHHENTVDKIDKSKWQTIINQKDIKPSGGDFSEVGNNLRIAWIEL